MSEKKINLFLYGSGQMKLELNPVNVNLKEIIISTRRNLALDQFETGTERINIATIKLLPTSMGESDLMKSLILIPGVKSVGEGSAGFNVRGGSADQNLILLYDTPLYNASHFFGFFSSVNSDVIKNVTLYKGGIPGKYGGRISSVLNIETSEGNMKKIAGSAGISPVTARITAEGPLVKDALTFVFSGRTTYSNWIFSLLKDSVLHKSRASFYDLNGKITYHPDPDNTIEAASYFSHDTFSFGNNTNYNYINNIWALKLAHVFSSSLTSSVSVSNSYYRYKMTNQDTPAEAYILSHIINTTGLKADFYLSSGKNNLNFGTEINKHRVLPGNYSPADNLSQILPDVTEIEKALEAAIYIDDKFQVTKYLSFSAGVRMSSFFSLGPKTVYHYMPDFSKSSSTITDTTFYHQGKVVSRYAGPEFRTSINFRLNDNNSFKINYNRTRQYLHLLSNTASISPTDTWKLCDPYLKPEIGDQVGIGFYNYLDKNNLETSAEVYYKEIKNMIDFKGGSTITMVKNIEQNIINEKGKAYGLELTIKKTSGRARYSIGYTYSRTFVKSLGKFKDEIINSGKWYPSNYDKPHDLVMTFQYFYSRRISFTADYTYNTGRPITYPVSSYHINGILLLNYSDRNKYRIPDYSRLDIACKISGNLKTRKIAHPNLIFSVYNLLGKENTYSIYFKKIGETVKGYKLSVFGRAMPSLTLNFDF
jgi:hypothetical protein